MEISEKKVSLEEDKYLQLLQRRIKQLRSILIQIVGKNSGLEWEIFFFSVLLEQGLANRLMGQIGSVACFCR